MRGGGGELSTTDDIEKKLIDTRGIRLIPPPDRDPSLREEELKKRSNRRSKKGSTPPPYRDSGLSGEDPRKTKKRPTARPGDKKKRQKLDTDDREEKTKHDAELKKRSNRRSKKGSSPPPDRDSGLSGEDPRKTKKRPTARPGDKKKRQKLDTDDREEKTKHDADSPQLDTPKTKKTVTWKRCSVPRIEKINKKRRTGAEIQKRVEEEDVSAGGEKPNQAIQPTPAVLHGLCRTEVLKALADPMSRKLLFVDSLEEDNMCYGFAAATSVVTCKSSGTPFDFDTGKTMDEGTDRKLSPLGEEILGRRNFFRLSVNPKDLVEFSVLNNAGPAIIVGCGLHRQRLSVEGGLLNECCHTTPLSRSQLAITGGKHVCFICKRKPAAYVTANRRLLCQYHAMRTRREDLLLYLPIFVSLDANEDTIWSSALLDSTAPRFTSTQPTTWGWYPLTHRLVEGLKEPEIASLKCTRLVGDYRKPRDIDQYDPLSVVQSLQRVCTLLADEEPCSWSDFMMLRFNRLVTDQRAGRQPIQATGGEAGLKDNTDSTQSVQNARGTSLPPPKEMVQQYVRRDSRDGLPTRP